ncbi:MAG: ATP-binding protein [Terriglobia bacterium]
MRRGTIERISAEHEHLSAIPHLQELLNAFPTPAVILNEGRQIVASNPRLCQLLERDENKLLGLRPGEAFNCIHWREGDCGCGTAHFCEACGAFQAILNTQLRGGQDIQECTITMQTDEGERALDLRVTASSLDLDGRFTAFAFDDIGDEKRRAVLERMFFHDVLNTAAGVRNLLEVLPALSDQYRQETSHLAFQLVQYLIEEVEAGKDLAAAERGDLAVHVTSLDAGQMLRTVCELYAHHPVSRGREVVAKEINGPCELASDKLLLQRVLGNLVKNALEASLEGEQVQLSFECRDTSAVFRVHNRAAMPESVRMQVFRRSFSTKSPVGRGIGTYSAKLITERYLGGSLSFTSSEQKGTTFTVTLPRSRQLSAFSSQQAPLRSV